MTCAGPTHFKKIFMTLRVLSTGGTFDKLYDSLSGQLVFGQSNIPDMLRQARIRQSTTWQALPAQDSLEMEGADRQRILQACRQAPESQLVIVHGTDTMQQTAAVLAQARLDKTLVLTGAMVPAQIAGSDAFFNLGFALGVVQTLPAGVYLAIQAEIFAWDEVVKDRTAGMFVALEKKSFAAD